MAFSEARHGTTILCVKRGGDAVIIGDGQVTQGNRVLKPNARKIRRLKKDVIMGFAGTTADAFTLMERLEGKLEEHPGQLLRSCVELAKMWRMDRYLRHLQAVMIVADQNIALEVTGNGDVLESHDGVLGVGSGSPYAIAAARALYPDASISVKDIAFRAMNIAADMCVHTNTNFIVEKISEASEAEVLAAAAATSTPTEPTTENRN
eukprot:GHVU01107059.1.p2 GENE.GHVU01107059.1~~GHVU01107059.1.p2  ORF type:complete len:207 (+),score=38.22 GHVU01107059.1:732-1352(+)